MSGLAALLAGHNPPDIYQWHNAAHVEDVQHAVEHANWTFFHFDTWTVEDRETFLKAASAALDLADPRDDFDGLARALGDVTAGDRQGIVLLWDGWSPLARHDEQAFKDALEVLRGKVASDRDGKFAVLLRGDGPDLDVPELPHKHN